MTRSARWGVTAAWFAAGLGLAAPFRSQFAYHWDSAEFALAVQHYDVALSQPHAPGYFLYVMLGRLVNLAVGDPHASLVWLSALAGGGLAAAMFWLGAAMFGRRAGVAAAAFALTSPQIWFHSCVALTYVVDALGVCVAGLVCYRMVERGGSWARCVGLGALLAVIGGVRSQSVPALMPLVFFTFWKLPRARFRQLLLTGAVAAGLALVWFVPMVAWSGGLPRYLELVRRHSLFNAPATWAGGGADALGWNIFFSVLFCADGLLAVGGILLAALLYRVWGLSEERKRAWDQRHALALQFLAIWIGSMLVVITALGFTKQPGYVLNQVTGLLLLAAGAVAAVRRRGAMVGIVALAGAVNAAAFLAWPPAWDGVFFGTGRTAREIRRHDRQMASALEELRQHADPSQTVVAHAAEYLHFGLRQFQLHAPEFDQLQFAADETMLHPPGQPLMAVRGGRLGFVSGLEAFGKTNLVLLVPPDKAVDVFAPYVDVRGARPLAPGRANLYALRLGPSGK